MNAKILLPLMCVSCLSGCDWLGGGRQNPAQQTATGSATVTSSATRPVTRPPATTQTVHDQDNAEGQHRKLYGTWVAQDVDVSMGEVKIKLTFRRDGPVHILAWSELPFVGQVRNKQAPYEIHGNTIASDALNGGTTVKYRFDSDHLVIEYKDGKTVRFTRAS